MADTAGSPRKTKISGTTCLCLKSKLQGGDQRHFQSKRYQGQKEIGTSYRQLMESKE